MDLPLLVSKTPLPVGKPVNQVHITQVAAETSRILEDSQLSSHRRHRKTAFVRKPAQTADTDADPMFSLDGFNDDCEPFFESEEDDLSSSGKNEVLTTSKDCPNFVTVS